MTQTFVDRYMEDDLVYRVIGFIQDNLRLMISFLLTVIVAFFGGKIYGIRTQSIVHSLKERYQNIEVHKKKLIKQIGILGSISKFLTKMIYMLLIVEFAIICNIIYYRGFDYTVLLDSSISRNIMFVSFLGILAIILLNRVVKRLRNTRVKIFSSIDSGLDDIAVSLLANLGPELVSILKGKLLTKSVNVKTEGVQTVPEPRPKPQPVEDPQEKIDLRNKLMQVEIATALLLKQIEKREVGKNILKKDLHRHKVFLSQIRDFEWCQYCLQFALVKDDESEQEKEGQQEDKNKEVVSSPEKTHPAIEENSEKQEDQKGNTDKKRELSETYTVSKEGDKEGCKKDCLTKYFELGGKISQQFNAEEGEIMEMENLYKSIETGAWIN